MDWKVLAALTLLVVAMLLGLVGVVYTSVSRYARGLDPSYRAAKLPLREDPITQ